MGRRVARARDLTTLAVDTVRAEAFASAENELSIPHRTPPLVGEGSVAYFLVFTKFTQEAAAHFWVTQCMNDRRRK